MVRLGSVAPVQFPPMEAAFFDLDKTIIARASMAAFGHHFYRGGLISRSTVVRALTSQLVYLHLGASEQKLAKIRESVLKLTCGWDQGEVSRIVRETLDEVVEPIIYAEALELLEQHHAEGRKTYLVSASPEEIVQPLAEYLGVDGALASRAGACDRLPTLRCALWPSSCSSAASAADSHSPRPPPLDRRG